MDAVEAWRKVCRVMGNAPERQPPKSVRARGDMSMDDKTEVTVATYTGNTSLSGIGRPRR
jgi:hypothetical protein